MASCLKRCIGADEKAGFGRHTVLETEAIISTGQAVPSESLAVVEEQDFCNGRVTSLLRSDFVASNLFLVDYLRTQFWLGGFGVNGGKPV